MNHNEDIAFKSLKIISNTESYDKKSGSLIINGGIGCKKTIHTESICANTGYFENLSCDLITECKFDNIKCKNFTADEIIAKDVYINNIEFDEAIFNKLIPKEYNSIIGSEDIRVNINANKINSNFGDFNINLNTKNLNVKNNTEISKDYKNRTMINVNSDDSIINFNFDILNLTGNKDSIEITDDGTKLNTLLILNCMIINTNDNDNDNDDINYIYSIKSFILIKGNKNIKFKLSIYKDKNEIDSFIEGSYLKIFNVSESIIEINNYILSVNYYSEFILINNNWIHLHNRSTLDIPVCSDHSEYCSHSDESCNSIHKKSNYVDNTTSDCCLSSDEEFTVGSIYN